MEFRDAVRIVLELEGGGRLVLHSKDPGGLTKFGISLKAYPQLGRLGISDLTEEEAIAIYRRDYWEALGVDRLPPCLRLALFDTAVNCGTKAAVEILQRALRILGAQVAVDGDLGPLTFGAIINYPAERVLIHLLLERQRFYRSLGTYSVFGLGWEKRILKVAISA
jgi:lysozyme family protein